MFLLCSSRKQDTKQEINFCLRTNNACSWQKIWQIEVLRQQGSLVVSPSPRRAHLLQRQEGGRVFKEVWHHLLCTFGSLDSLGSIPISSYVLG